MIKIKLKELLARKTYEGQRLTLKGLSAQTGLSRTTLHRIANIPGYSTTTEQLDKLCQALHCDIHELIEYVENS